MRQEDEWWPEKELPAGGSNSRANCSFESAVAGCDAGVVTGPMYTSH